MSQDRFDVVVAGAGAMGSAAAWRLSRRGLSVLLLDRFHPPHSEGSSHGGSRVIREMAFEHPRYVPLVRWAYELWDELGAEPHKLLIPTGALYLGAESATAVAGSRTSAVTHGVPFEELTTADIRERWPAFRPAAGDVGLFERRAGVLRPEACIEAMLGRATWKGVVTAFGEPLLEWSASGDGVSVKTSKRSVSAGALVLSTGPWLRDELRRLGVAAWVERMVQHWFRPRPDAHGLGPDELPIFLREDSAGIFFYGFPVMDGMLKCALHHRGEDTDMSSVRRDVSAGEITQVREQLEQLLPDAAGEHVGSSVCLYTNSPDGDFILDRHPESGRVIVCSPCSGMGFKFAPMIGELVAELVAGNEPPELADFRLARFRKRA